MGNHGVTVAPYLAPFDRDGSARYSRRILPAGEPAARPVFGVSR
jgi:hypothetical protein